MVCPDCGAEAAAGDRFCAECGGRLTRACAACGAELGATARFCVACGARAGPSSPAPPPAAVPVAERRVTSVLFADLVGFTTLSESRDPEDVRELLSGYFQRCRRIVARYGGTIEKFIGDAVMAVWGVPVAHEDDAERAVRAGVDLTAEVARFGERSGMAGLALRVGVVTGEVAVTVGAVGEGMVAGDAVNTAARVQSCARPGAVWTDDQTRSLSADVADFAAQGPHALRGKAEPLALFEVVAIRGDRGGARTPSTGQVPLVGRDDETTAVVAAFHATVRSGRGNLVVVLGPPGVGKSRLGAELEHRLDDLATTVRWHWGRALSYGDRVAFSPLAAAVRGRVGVGDDDGPAEVATKIAADLAGHTDDAATVSRLTARLGVLLAATADIPFSRDDLFSAWLEWFELLGADGSPVVWVVDDAHHADDGVLEFVDLLVAAARAPVLVVLLARPELLERRPQLDASPRATVVRLAGLPPAAMADLFAALAPDLPSPVVDMLTARSDGVPLYAVELARALTDRGSPGPPRDGLRTPGGTTAELIDRMGAPTSLRVLISSRLDVLPTADRALLGSAAVLGSSFSVDALRALTARPSGEIVAALRELVRRDLLRQVDDPLSAEDGQYTFVQTFVRQVAYETQSRRDRGERHLAAVAHLERSPDTAGTSAAVVAAHLTAARDLLRDTDPRQPDLSARARVWHERAGDRALSLGAPADALASHLAALACGGDPDDVVRLHLSAAVAAITAGRYDVAVDQARAVGDDASLEHRARAAAVAGQALRRDGRVAEARDLLSPWRERIADLTPASASDLLRELAFTLHSLGDLDAATPLGLQALRHAEWADDPALVARALNVVGIHADLGGRWRTGRALYTQAADLARARDLPVELGFVLQNLSTLEVTRDPAAAVDTARDALDLAQRTGHVGQAIYAATNLVEGLRAVGRWDDALAVAAERVVGDSIAAGQLDMRQLALDLGAIALARGVPPVGMSVRSAGVTGEDPVVEAVLAAARGEVAAAFELARGALLARHAATALEEEFGVLWVATVEWAVEAGRLDEARALLTLVADAPADEVTPTLAAQLVRLRGTVGARSAVSPDGRVADVETDLRAAVDALDRLGVVTARARAQGELGRWLTTQGRSAEAAPLFADARAEFDRLGAVAWSAELDA